MSTTATGPAKVRLYELDWIRAGAFVLLVVTHTTYVFLPGGWIIANQESSVPLYLLMQALGFWRVPLLFFVSGVSLRYVLMKPSTRAVLQERTVRLLLPFLIGMLLLVTPQLYLSHLHLNPGKTDVSYLQFLRDNFRWQVHPLLGFGMQHLWYIIYIFLYTVLFCVLKRLGWLSRLQVSITQANWFNASLAGSLLLLGLPLVAGDLLFTQRLIHFPSYFGQVFRLGYCLVTFTYGYCYPSQVFFTRQLLRHRRWLLLLALAGTGLFLIGFYWLWQLKVPNTNQVGPWLVYFTVKNYLMVVTLAAILAYGQVYLRFNHPLLRKLNEAVYPFYLVHQTVLVALAFVIVEWSLEVPYKFLLILGLTYLLSGMAYYFLIKRNQWLRLAFGMPRHPKSS